MTVGETTPMALAARHKEPDGTGPYTVRFLAAAESWRVDVGSRLAKPSRSDATAWSDLDPAAGSGTMNSRGRRHRDTSGCVPELSLADQRRPEV